MPFYCGKRAAGICVVLGPKQSRLPQGTRPAHISRACTDVASLIRDAVHLGGAHKHGATYSSHRAPSTYTLVKERVLARLGWAGVIGYASGFSSLRPRIYQQLLRLATKDYSDRLLADG